MWNINVYLFLIALPSSSCLLPNPANSTDIFSRIDVFKTIRDLLKFDGSTINKINSLVSENFTNACILAFTKLNRNEIGAYIDADGKPQAGIAFGGFNWMGSSSECLSQKNSRFCTMNNIFVEGLSNSFAPAINLGLCVPDICEAKDITMILTVLSNITKIGNKHLFTIQRNPVSIMTNGDDAFCSEKTLNIPSGTIVMIVITSILLALCFLGTLAEMVYDFMQKHSTHKYILHIEEESINKGYDEKKNEITMHLVKTENKGGMLSEFLICFSLLKNTKTLFNTDSPDGAITSISGIRVLSIMWVVLGHILVFDLGTFDNLLTVASWEKRFTMQGVLNATLSVDTFFLMSGLLVAYLSMKRYNKTGNLPLLRYYVHRYVRLTPSYAYMIFFFAYMFPVISSGPFWYTQASKSHQIKSCEKYWWTNLLYINNFYPVQTDMCAGHSWYLANDMQFYVLSPIILWFMHRFKLIGTLVINGLLIIVCFVTNGILMDHFNASPLIFQGASNDLENQSIMSYMSNIYMKFYARYSPYLIGLILGYILANKYTLEGRFKYAFNIMGWFCAVVTGVSVIYGPYTVTDHLWNHAEVYTYGISFRCVWAIAVSWVIFACHSGFGGLVNDLMSWRAFIPLGRLSYAVYLIHPMVINLFFASSQVAVDMTILNYAYLFVSMTTISFGCAYVLAVCVEYPVFNLEMFLEKLSR